MLAEIFIQNLAVIEQTTIPFEIGLNVFTGETGAGKSIVVDAINAILGRKVSREIVRTGAEKAVVQAFFRELPPHIHTALQELGYDAEEGELTITREISADGGSTARLNGRAVTVGVLRQLGDLLIHIHGQNDNQVLLAANRHIHLLDSFGNYGNLLEEYRQTYRLYRSILQEIERFSTDEREKEHRQDLLRFQIGELEQADLQPDEEEELLSERKVIRNAEKIYDSLQQAYFALAGSDEFDGAIQLSSNAGDAAGDAAVYLADAAEPSEKLTALSYELDAVADEIRSMMEQVEFEPERLNEIEVRLDEIHTLKRKYGSTVEEVLQYLDSAKEELEQIETSDERLGELNRERKKIKDMLYELANRLTDKRKTASKQFTEKIAKELQFLDMPNVKMEILFTPADPGPDGAESVDFLISANLGEPPKPIAKIASGGELSRIMLAIKNTLAGKDAVMTSIFDEIDAGVSGRAAQKIGLKLKEASKGRQVICVTHSAQIASLANVHFLIEKTTRSNRTFTEVHALDFDGRVEEVARIMGTDTVTDLMRQNAAEMIRNGMHVDKV